MESILNINTINSKGYTVQPKLNGVWAQWDGEKLFTKGGHEITSMPHVVSKLSGSKSATGELYYHGESLQVIHGHVMGPGGPGCKKVCFYEFTGIKKHHPQTIQELKHIYESILADGYEGMVLTHIKTGEQFKVKPVQDMEGVLIGFNPGTGRNKDTFGSLRLRLSSGVEFNCGGLKDKDKARLWKNKPIGIQITFYFAYLTDGGVPFHPRFKCERTDNVNPASRVGRPNKTKSEYRGVRKLYRWTESEHLEIKKATERLGCLESELIRKAVLDYISKSED